MMKLEDRLNKVEQQLRYLLQVQKGIENSTGGWDGSCLVLQDLTIVGNIKVANTLTGEISFRQITLADDATIALETILPRNQGTLIIAVSSSSDVAGSVYLGGDGDVVTEISDPFAKIVNTDTDTNLCIIADGDNTYTLKNRLGGSRTFTLMFIGA
jgi:hypothetical protein